MFLNFLPGGFDILASAVRRMTTRNTEHNRDRGNKQESYFFVITVPFV